MDEFYLQDKRSYVGNDMLFWADGGGYTTDVSKAEVFTKDRAIELNYSRETDLPWPKEYIDNKNRPAVDMQYVSITEALSGTGIIPAKIPKQRKPVYNCNGCGKFLSQSDIYGDCPHCNADNRP